VIAIRSKTVRHPVETRTGKHTLARNPRPSVSQDFAECDDELEKRHVIISSSSGEANGKVSQREVEYHDVVSPSDPDQFIHLVSDDAQARVRRTMQQLDTSLSELGLTVSTGRVVDFRARDFLRQQPERGTVPLIYPCHFTGGFVNWPKPNGRKPNAIVDDEHTRDLLVPAGIYVLVKRFSSKEERRRVVACIYDSSRIQAPWVGFENHLNYFHANGAGLPDVLAKGLAAFLNSTLVDAFFRQFNGHTQVNATDLRSLHYPTKKQLLQLGREVGAHGLEQAQLDLLVERVLDVATQENRKTMQSFITQISWETEVWVAEAPDHLIHFNGERFLGPYPDALPAARQSC
jgi:adenine-specific DNA-methyltransferase